MKRTNFGKRPASTRTLRLNSETVRKLAPLTEGQLRHAAGGNTIHSLDDFCWEDTVYCPA